MSFIISLKKKKVPLEQSSDRVSFLVDSFDERHRFIQGLLVVVHSHVNDAHLVEHPADVVVALLFQSPHSLVFLHKRKTLQLSQLFLWKKRRIMNRFSKTQ